MLQIISDIAGKGVNKILRNTTLGKNVQEQLSLIASNTCMNIVKDTTKFISLAPLIIEVAGQIRVSFGWSSNSIQLDDKLFIISQYPAHNSHWCRAKFKLCSVRQIKV